MEYEEKGIVKINLKDLNDLIESHNKYKQMWDEVFRYDFLSFHEVDVLNKIKRKYFPEPELFKKTVTIIAENKEKMDKILNIMNKDALA